MSLTIKQAFEKLAMVTGAAVKNPWFVCRNLNQAFADIAENIEGGGGGSTVEVTQVVSSGTKIATIKVDDASTDLFAPEGGGNIYSATETKIGSYLGSDLYRIVIQLESAYEPKPAGTELPASVQTFLAGADTVISCHGVSATQCVDIGLEYASNTWSGYTAVEWALTDLIFEYTKPSS